MATAVVELAGNEDLTLTPPVKGKERLYGWYPPANPQFGTPDYKIMTTLEDNDRFNAQIPFPPRPPSSKGQRSKSASLTGSQTQPCIKQGRSGDNRPALSAKMDAIRRDLVQRQKEAPLVRMLSGQIKASGGKNGAMRTFSAAPPGWKPRYPEPDLRSFISGTESSSTSSTSLRQSISIPTPPEQPSRPVIEPTVVRPPTAQAAFDRPCAPTPGASEKISQERSRPVRPKTAPPQLRKSNVVETPAHPSHQLDLCLRGRRVQSAQPFRRFLVPKATQVQMTPSTQESEQAPAVVAWAEDKKEEVKEEEEEVVPSLLEDEYDKALKKFGWRMEVPNDPLGLKRPHIAKRLDYTVSIPIPEVLPLPPPMHKENRETFFHTSLPRPVYSFDINPDFMSERYNAARDAMRKKGKWNYAFKDFSFVY